MNTGRRLGGGGAGRQSSPPGRFAPPPPLARTTLRVIRIHESSLRTGESGARTPRDKNNNDIRYISILCIAAVYE